MSEVLHELKLKVENNDIGREISIIVDGMSIRKQTMWDRKEQKYTDFVDYGNYAVVECNEEHAQEALVVMAVCTTGQSWKSIIAYFLCSKVNSSVLAQLTRAALDFLTDAGFITLSIV